MGGYTPVPPGLEAPEREGSPLLGLFGALLGALAGAVPWLTASLFAGYFVGWLGFLVGCAACLGYCKLGGLRSTWFAMAVILFSTLGALVLANFTSNLYLLCTDPVWRRFAAHYGLTVEQLALQSLMMPVNWPPLLPGLVHGVAAGLLGVFFARRRVLKYTDPGKADALAARRTSQSTPPAAAGKPLPRVFTVGQSRIVTVLGWGFLLFSMVWIVICLLGALGGASWLEMSPILLTILVFTGLGLWLRGLSRHRIEVSGEVLRCCAAVGWAQVFQVGEIGGAHLSQTGVCRLYDRDGRVLALFHQKMKNYPLLVQYLAEHRVSLRG